MANSFTLLFFLRKPKQYKFGPVPIYLRITVNGQRKEVVTGRLCDPDKWNPAAERMIGSREAARILNNHLDSLVAHLHRKQTDLLNNGESVTVEVLRNDLKGVEKHPNMLLQIFQLHNDDIEQLIGKGYSRPTLTKFNTTRDHLQNFIKSKYHISDISLNQLKFEFLSDFEFYLKTEKNIGHNTTVKYITNTRKIINECLKKRWLKADPFLGYSITVHETTPIFLSEEELQKIVEIKFSIRRLELVRDMFVFSCYTGLAFIDVFNLTSKNIAIGIDGRKWIITSRQKTDNASHIPLLPPAMAVIQKYADDPAAVNKGRLLPILSNQKMNAYLKEIADLCGINKELTYHCARHTFATTVTLTNGVPIESVSKMLGHKKIQTTQHYAKILDKKVSADMSILFNKFKVPQELDNQEAISS